LKTTSLGKQYKLLQVIIYEREKGSTCFPHPKEMTVGDPAYIINAVKGKHGK
jgi:hypothetical protein